MHGAVIGERVCTIVVEVYMQCLLLWSVPW